MVRTRIVVPAGITIDGLADAGLFAEPGDAAGFAGTGVLKLIFSI
jgi:hypothetical protein